MAVIAEREDRHKNNLSIPSSPPATLDAAPRDVFIVHRVMRGDGIIEQFTDQEKGVERLLGVDAPPEVPHPLHHWGVSVGGVLHHLQSDAFFDTPNYYENKALPGDEGYIPYKVGTTTFSDLAIQESGVATIYDMPATYDPISNNCQRFTLELVGIIVRSGRVVVRTLEDVSVSLDSFFPGIVGVLRELAKDAQQPETEAALPKPVTAAVVQDPEAMKKLLDNVESIMVENTPMVNKNNIEAELQK